ncbi:MULTISPECIES: hypothetical protein [Rhizobium]|uniref:hypothetical protein n=1 Tax=Rhizobium TaxID=379 RepID=UPI00195AA3FC|nr:MULTISPECIES: hypothetical protein [Rhizobium]MBM7045701.1 hypothetical protein [Rhizobium lusitanum]
MLKQIHTISMTLAVLAGASNAYAIGPAGMARDISHSSIVLQAKLPYSSRSERFARADDSSGSENLHPYCVASGKVETQDFGLPSLIAL